MKCRSFIKEGKVEKYKGRWRKREEEQIKIFFRHIVLHVKVGVFSYFVSNVIAKCLLFICKGGGVDYSYLAARKVFVELIYCSYRCYSFLLQAIMIEWRNVNEKSDVWISDNFDITQKEEKVP